MQNSNRSILNLINSSLEITERPEDAAAIHLFNTDRTHVADGAFHDPKTQMSELKMTPHPS